MRCTPTSVVAHTLYENADPYRLVEPSGTLDTRSATYEPSSDRAVRVRGSRFEHADRYTVRLEATEYLGHRFALIAGIRDPMVLRQLDPWLAELRGRIAQKVTASLDLNIDIDYQMSFRIYGKNGSMGPLEPTPEITSHEVGLVVEVIAADAGKARDVLTIAGHTGLHHPIPEWHGLISNWAFPYSPPEMDAGPVYRFSMNHVLDRADIRRARARGAVHRARQRPGAQGVDSEASAFRRSGGYGCVWRAAARSAGGSGDS
jgi:hypothetical protein